MFIVFEGLDGAGKTTQIKLLADALRRHGYTVTVTRDPGGTGAGDKIRQILLYNDMSPMAQLLLFAASRAELVHAVIMPALQRGEVVLCDRFTDSTMAYQGYGHGLNMNYIQQLNDMSTFGLIPDLTIYLDISVKECMRRKSLMAKDKLDSLDEAFYGRVKDGYWLELNNDTLVFGYMAIDKVANDIFEGVMGYFKERGHEPN